MSRSQIGVWIEKLLFFVLFSGYYTGVIFLAWVILPPDKSVAIEALSHADQTCLSWSVMFGFALGLWGAASALFNLKMAMKSRELIFIFKNAMDMLFCIGIALMPIIVINVRFSIQETFNPLFWLGLVALFLFGAAFHYRRAEKTRRSLKGERLCVR